VLLWVLLEVQVPLLQDHPSSTKQQSAARQQQQQQGVRSSPLSYRSGRGGTA
jgi:hypothetical protein